MGREAAGGSRRRVAGGLSLVCACVVLVFGAARAHATVMVELSLEELVAQCDGVVHGVVQRTGTQMAVQGSAEPYSIAQLDVVEWIAGHGGPSVTLREAGAYWRTGGVRVDGTPSYRRGEEVVVFLTQDVNGFHRTCGMAQGKFVVQRPIDGLAHVERDLRAATFVRWKARRNLLEPGQRRALATLGVFVGFLRELSELRP